MVKIRGKRVFKHPLLGGANLRGFKLKTLGWVAE